MRLIDADVLKQHIDKLPALPDGNFAGNHSALKALINMQPTIEPSTNCSEFPNNSDTVSRQAAIDAINSWRGRFSEEYNEAIDDCENSIKELPPVPQERKKGKWIGTEFDGYADGNPVFYEWQCSECGCIFEDEEPTYNYCPKCGARMKGERQK